MLKILTESSGHRHSTQLVRATVLTGLASSIVALSVVVKGQWERCFCEREWRGKPVNN